MSYFLRNERNAAVSKPPPSPYSRIERSIAKRCEDLPGQRQTFNWRRTAAIMMVVAGFLACPSLSEAQEPSTEPGQEAEPAPLAATPSGSGLPVPRFVSLKSDRVNLRNGPSTEYPTGWVFRRAGLPLEVIKEFEAWRQVRDAEGATGWVLQSLLSGRRTALILPWELKAGATVPQVSIRVSEGDNSGVVASVEAGVIANLHDCNGRWCRVTIDAYTGYIEQKKLWGVYEGETLK